METTVNVSNDNHECAIKNKTLLFRVKTAAYSRVKHLKYIINDILFCIQSGNNLY